MISDYFVGRYLKSFPFGNKSVSICNKEELSKPSHYSKSQTPILYVTMIDNGNKNLIKYYFLKFLSTDPNFENHVNGNIHNFFWINFIFGRSGYIKNIPEIVLKYIIIRILLVPEVLLTTHFFLLNKVYFEQKGRKLLLMQVQQMYLI